MSRLFTRRPGARFGDHRGRIPTGAAAGLSPPNVVLGANLLQWLEAPSCTVGSGVVSAVQDLSSNAYGYTASGASQPTYETGGFNGQDAWFFDGSNDFFIDDNSGAFATALTGGSDKAYTMWLAVQLLSLPVSGGYLWSCGASGGTLPHTGQLGLSTSSTLRTAKRDTTNPQKNVDATGFTLTRGVLTMTCTGTTMQVKLNNVEIAAAVADNFNVDSCTFNKDTIGCLGRSTNTIFAKMRVAARVCRAGVASAAEDAAMYAYMENFLTASAANPMLIIAGDSLSLADKWYVNVAAAYPSATLVDRATGGEVLHGTGGLGQQFDEITSNYDSTRPVNLAVQHYGSNDIALDHRTAAQLITDATSWATAEKAANPGRLLVACTIHKRGGATPIAGADETERAAYNTDIRANYATYGYDYLLDKDNIITELPTDTSIFADEIHLTDAGDTHLANGRNGYDGMIAIMADAGF